jgi:hypothetical protein
MPRFRAIVVLEGVETGDRRFINLGALTHRALPLTLMGMTRNPDGGYGHDGAEVVGRIDTLTREDASDWIDESTGTTWRETAGGTDVYAWIGEGEFDDRAEAVDVEQLVRDQHLRGISVDLAATESEVEVTEEDEDGWPVDWLDRLTAGEIAAATVCNIPAFRGCTIELTGDAEPAAEAQADQGLAASGGPWLPAFRVLADGPGCTPCGVDPRTRTSVTASGGPLEPPAAWFADPGLDGPSPLTVHDDGRVVGHLAVWGTCHTGFSGQCITPPTSRTGYALFRTGAVRTAEGQDVPVGHITLGTGHADLHAAAGPAAAHYDDTGSVVADIATGEDAHGIWVAGALRPDVSDLQVRQLRSAPLSGDWRRHGGGLELVAALAVNTPGFPVVRSVAASGVPQALVAAGARAVKATSDPFGGPDARKVMAGLHQELLHLQRDRMLRRLGRR